MPAQDFELILRVQADLQTAVSQLRTLNDQMRVIKSGAQEASGGLQNLTDAAGRVNSQLRSLGTSVNSVGAQMHSLVAAVASLVAIHEIAGFIENVIEANQQLGDMAQKVGVSTEALSTLGNVAKRNGSDLQGVQQAFVKLARAATGLDQEGGRALKAMNINLADFQKLKPEQQFDLVAQKFADYSDGANKAALATALFGKSGADLIPTLNAVGQQGLQNITDKAIAAGTAVGGTAVQASQNFSNALETLKEKLAGAVNEGLVQFTPEIQHLSELVDDPQFDQALKDTADGIAGIAKAAANGVTDLISFISQMQQIAGFHLDGNIGGDTGYAVALGRQQAIQDEIDRRAQASSHLGALGTLGQRNIEVASSLGTLLNPLALSPNTNADAMQSAALAFKSDADLKAELAKLTIDINHYRAESNKQAAAKNPQEGDTRGLFVGEGGKTQAPIVPGAGVDKLAKQAAQAQQQLTQSLIDLQGALDPTAAIYAKFNDTVKNATDEAELAKKAHGANAQAIDSQRDAVVALAGKVRDAALDQLAEKDRLAWEALRRSFETPAQVRVEDAIKQIQQLDDMLKKGIITAQQYHDALTQIGQKAVTGALPDYKGVGASVGGAYGELQKNYQAQTALDAAYQAQKLALDKQFNDQDEAQHAAHLAAMAKLDEDYKNQNLKIEQSRSTLQLQAASSLFGQLAQLSSSHNKKIAAIGKAAAIAQTIIQTYQSATEAYAAMASIPYIGPALGIAAAAAAIAAGLANVAQIRNQNVSSGYAEGGYTGPGAVNQPAGIVHAGEVVFSQADISRFGGVARVEMARLRGYADGGFVSPLANAPSPAQMGFSVPASPRVDFSKLAAANDARASGTGVGVRIVNSIDPEFATSAMNSAAGEKVIMNVLSRNATKLKQMVR